MKRILPLMAAFFPVLGDGEDLDRWKVETLTEGISGASNALLFLPNGNPLIAFSDRSSNSFKEAEGFGQTWRFKTIDPEVAPGSISMLITPTGRVIAAYVEPRQKSVRVAERTPEGWIISTISEERGITDAVSLTCSNNGTLTLAYFDNSNLQCRILTKTKDKWQEHSLLATGGFAPRMAIGKNRQLSILFSSGNRTSFSQFIDGKWTEPTHLSGGKSHEQHALSTNPQGHLIALYWSKDPKGATFGTFDSKKWSESLVRAGPFGRSPSLKTGPNETIGATFYEESDLLDANLLYSELQEDGSWKTEKAASKGGGGYDTSLAYDQKGNPAISFYSLESRSLCIARRIPTRK